MALRLLKCKNLHFRFLNCFTDTHKINVEYDILLYIYVQFLMSFIIQSIQFIMEYLLGLIMNYSTILKILQHH